MTTCWKSRNFWNFWDRLTGVFPALILELTPEEEEFLQSSYFAAILGKKILIKLEAQF